MKNVNEIVGTNLKQIREERGLSLDKVAELTGVSKSMLGQVERGETSPSIATIWKIANGLRVSFSTFIQEETIQISVKRHDKIEPVIGDEGRYRVFSVFPFDAVKRFEIYTMEMDPDGFYQSEPHFKGVEEYVTVFQGKLEIGVGSETYLISEGDTINFAADITHTYRNLGTEIVKVYMLIFYP